MDVKIHYKQPKSVLNKTGGFLKGSYTHTVNPYSGCAFGCKYCYVQELPIQKFRTKMIEELNKETGELEQIQVSQSWGTWVDAKENSAEILTKEIRRERKAGRPVRIFMSSSTDPYQPEEKKARITRSYLQAMLQEPPDYLCIQTRSPHILDDLELIKTLSGKCSLMVSMTVETNQESVKREFAPNAPGIRSRMKAMRTLKESGIFVQAAVSPVLPFTREFPQELRGCADRICVDTLFLGDGENGKRSEKLGLEPIFEKIGKTSWYKPGVHEPIQQLFEAAFGEENVLLSKEGFAPHK